MSTSRARETFDTRLEIWDGVGAITILGGAGLLTGMVMIATLTGLSISPVIWYIARAAGLTTYLLLWLSVVTGLGLTTRMLGFIGNPGAIMQLHRLATDLAIAGTVIHLLSVALDPTVQIGMLGVLVPFVSPVRQPWADLGILAAYGLIGISLTFAARRWIGKERWRALHYLTFGFWALALAHGIGAGTDTTTIWAGALYILTSSTVIFLLTYRVLQPHAQAPARRTAQSRSSDARP